MPSEITKNETIFFKYLELKVTFLRIWGKKCLSDDEQGWNNWLKICTVNMSNTKEVKIKYRVKNTSVLINSGEYLQTGRLRGDNKKNWQGSDMQIK